MTAHEFPEYKENAFLAAIIDSSDDAIISKDLNGVINSWNRSAERILGYTAEEVIGKHIITLIIPPDRQHEEVSILSRIRQGIRVDHFETEHLHKSGKLVPLSVTVSPIKDYDGVIIGASKVARDISERIETAAELNEVKEHLRLMVESAVDFAIISTDTKGCITSWSPGAENLFDYTASEVIGEPLSLIFTPEDVEAGAHKVEIRTATLTGRALDERWHMRKNGQRFYASGILAAMKTDASELIGFTKIARDVTAQKRAEEALIEARNAAEAANIAKSEFLANMSHEIRTPMNAVIGLSNILAMSETLTRKEREYVKTLQISADSLLALINDLLDIAKIESRSVELERVPFSLMRMGHEVISMMAVRAREKNLAFTLQAVSPSLQRRMYVGDPTRLRQILLNLCRNAIKFTDTGSITVTIDTVATDESDIEEIILSVKDTGIGIAQDKQETIFNKFVQADSSINRKYGGTGLGLAITKTLIDMMSGTISLQSEFGKGSVFTVRLPLMIASKTDIAHTNLSLDAIAETRETSVTRLKILLVEDYLPNVLVAGTFLEQFGYSYDVAHSGLEAVEMTLANNYALVLMDVQMHGMNGLEATRLIRDRCGASAHHRHDRPFPDRGSRTLPWRGHGRIYLQTL